jgi:integrase
MTKTRCDQEKAANGAGGVERRGKVWWARISLPAGGRKRVPIPNSEKMSEAMAREKAAYISEQVRLGKIIFDTTPRAKGGLPSAAAPLTVRQLATQWTSGALFERFGPVNRLKVKAGAYIDKVTLAAHVLEVKTRGASGPAFGDLVVTDVTADDVAAVMAAQPKDHRAQTRLHTYVRLRRIFDLAIYPLKLRKEGDTPVSRYLRPERDPEKLFCFLYPSEVIALLRGTNEAGEVAIPLARRVLYALGVYTGQRKGSLFAMQWKHVDAKHGTLASFKTKTGRAQHFVADRGLMALLRAWHLHCGSPDAEQAIVLPPKRKKKHDDPRDVREIEIDPKRLANALRDDLKAVGITRAILFEDEAPNVEPLRFHDLRSTFCTWARREGRSDVWISERTGHDLDGDMINRYDRGAQTLTDLEYAPFPDLTGAVPELAALATQLATEASTPSANSPDDVPKNRKAPKAYLPSKPVGASGFEPPTPRPPVESSTYEESPPSANSQIGVGDSMPVDAPKSADGRDGPTHGATAIDPVETALAEALTKASAAGEWSVVAQLARELEARRQSRAGNVVTLRSGRARQ